MVRTHVLLPLLLSGLLVSCDETATKSVDASAIPRPRTEAEFLSSLVEATRSGEPDAVKALVHPATLQLIDEQKEDFFSDWLSREANRAIPEMYRTTTTPISPHAPLPFEGAFVYPVRPTSALQIDFDDSAGGSVSMIRSVVVDDHGVWWLVVPVPNAETLERMQRSRADRERMDQRASDLVRHIEEPLRGELEALLREGRKIAAIKRYREVSGEGLRVAKSVVGGLEAQIRSSSQN